MNPNSSVGSTTKDCGEVWRGSGRCFLVAVAAETLTSIIQRYLLPEIIIVSDGWKVYNRIDEIDSGVYEHNVIIHENFVYPLNVNIHTQKVENMRMRAKCKLRHQFGTSEALFPSYLQKFMWRNEFRGRESCYNFKGSRNIIVLGQLYNVVPWQKNACTKEFQSMKK